MKFYPIIGPVIILLTWSILTSLGLVSPIILPPPLAVGKALGSLLVSEGSLWPHLALTLFRTLLSFILASIIGVPLGLFMGYIPGLYKAFEFIVDFFRSIPPIALFPLFLLVLGIGELSKLGVPLYGCLLVVTVSSIYGVLNAPVLRRTVGEVYGFSKWQVFRKIVLPDSLPQVFVGMRTALSLALVLTVVVEMLIGSNNGLGKQIYDYQLLFDTPEMYGVIILTGAIGYLLNQGFLYLERRILHWVDK